MNRIDMLDSLARGFGIADTEGQRGMDPDAYRWRCICDEMVQAMSEEEARDLMEFIARMRGIDLNDVSE